MVNADLQVSGQQQLWNTAFDEGLYYAEMPFAEGT